MSSETFSEHNKASAMVLWIKSLTNFSKDSLQLFGLALNATQYNVQLSSYSFIYTFILMCNLALTRLHIMELYYAKSI